ncbi:MAG TPA: HlyD family secretion protein, partial [Saprospiraceae bacterium]|nr:HlyD family secretion protein [Saprospiraceae bacterium]
NGKSRRGFILAGIGLFALGLFLYFKISAMGHEQTNNAQLDATITPVRNIVPGFITRINFIENQPVKKDSVLIEIDRTDYLAKADQAEAALQSAKAQLDIARTGVTTARSNVDATALNSQAAKENIKAAQAKVTRNQQEMDRLEKMKKDGSATQQQYEATWAELESSKAQLDMLQKQYEASTNQVKGAKSQAEGQRAQIDLAMALVKQREAELKLAQTQLNNTIIRAPFDGIVSKKSIEAGQYLQAGAPVCSVVDYGHLWVSANFKETQIEDIRPGQEVKIKVDAFPHAKLTGTVESFGGATGAKFSLLPPDNATGNFVKITQRVPVRIAITSYPKELTGLLLPGLSAIA